MLYISIFSNKFDLNQATGVSHTKLIGQMSFSQQIMIMSVGQNVRTSNITERTTLGEGI
jgi:hypothetical protein